MRDSALAPAGRRQAAGRFDRRRTSCRHRLAGGAPTPGRCRPPRRRTTGAILARGLAALAIVAVGLVAQPAAADAPTVSAATPRTIRIALFNIRELSTAKLTNVDAEGIGLDEQVRAAAAIIQRVRPDVLVLNEIDHDYTTPGLPLDLNARRFEEAYLARGAAPIRYPFAFAAPCNTGILSGVDFDGNGRVATAADAGERDHGNDAFGYGIYPGQYSMAVLSRVPLDADAARTFQTFRWVDLPGALIPEGYYSDEALEVFRLSSKSHWDVPVRLEGRTIHLLASHPTPQGFDGPEDRNGRRNFDEIRFWAEYVDDEQALYDDAGRRGGLAPGASFLVVGDLNCAPIPSSRSSQYHGAPAIVHLMNHERVRDSGPWIRRAGARDGQGLPPSTPESASDHTHDSGNRIDYLLPSTDLTVLGGGIFHPPHVDDPEGANWASAASDHRLLWIDLRW